jgi:predicted Rossmann fold flavoprotein
VLCTGGKVAKNFGTDGSAYALAIALGHSVTALYPSLVQLKTDTDYVKQLKGIRVFSRVKAIVNGKEVASETGDVIFTDYGVSGDVIFRLSAFVSDKTTGDVMLEIDLLPDISEQKLREVLQQKSELNHIPSGEILCGILNNQVGRVVVKRAKSESVDALVEQVKRFKLKVTGTLGYDYAQVTKGGVPLGEVDDTLQSKSCRGLYLAGEILDVDGRCGGYNLQWAFTSASIIADAIRK